MTTQIIRDIVQVQVVRRTARVQVGAAQTFQVLRSPGGPRGRAAAQDIGWVLSGTLGPGEVINSPPLPHATSFAWIYAHSDSGFAESQTLTVQQKRAGSVIATASLAVTPVGNDWSTSINALSAAVADVFALMLPSSADGRCVDLSVSLGSTP